MPRQHEWDDEVIEAHLLSASSGIQLTLNAGVIYDEGAVKAFGTAWMHL